MRQTLLVPLDFSDAVPEVTDCASALAKATGAQVVLLHVEAPDPAFVGYEAGPQTVRDSVARTIHRDANSLHAIRDRMRAAGLEVESLQIQGSTAEKIVAEAQRLNADYIVMGSHGHGALHHLVVGSVTDAVIRRAPCPVIIVPHVKKGT